MSQEDRDETIPPHNVSFDQLLTQSQLPPPGPSHYDARRSLWLTPQTHRQAQRDSEPSAMRVKLEQMLSQPGAVDSDEVWNGGINKVWTALLAGAKLKKRLPMEIVVCV
jgi:hypothetical protein